MRLARLALGAALILGGCGGGGSAAGVATGSAPAPVPTAAPAPSPTPAPTPLADLPPACTAAGAVLRAADLRVAPRSGKVAVVAIGSSSTAGAYASSPDATYPSVLGRILAAHPEIAAYTVHNKGVGGDTLAATQARLQRDALDLHPQLVILQAGTNDAVNGQTDEALADYAARLRQAVSTLRVKVPVVLMNGQHYSNEPSNYGAYLAVMDQVSQEQGVPLFDRYALMRGWVDSGRYGFADILASDGFHPNDLMYRCMGQVMADLILTHTAH